MGLADLKLPTKEELLVICEKIDKERVDRKAECAAAGHQWSGGCSSDGYHWDEFCTYCLDTRTRVGYPDWWHKPIGVAV